MTPEERKQLLSYPASVEVKPDYQNPSTYIDLLPTRDFGGPVKRAQEPVIRIPKKIVSGQSSTLNTTLTVRLAVSNAGSWGSETVQVQGVVT